MAPLVAARRTRAPVRNREEVLRCHNGRLGVDAREADVDHLRKNTRGIAVQYRIERVEAGEGPLAERQVAGDALGTLGDRGASGSSKASDEVDRDRAGSKTPLLPAADHERRDRGAPELAAPDDKHADPFRAVHLVRGPTDQVDSWVSNLIELLAEALSRVSVEEHARGQLLRDVFERLDDTGLVVDVHETHEPGLRFHGSEQLLGIHHAGGVTPNARDSEAALFHQQNRLENRLVLERRRDDMAPVRLL